LEQKHKREKKPAWSIHNFSAGFLDFQEKVWYNKDRVTIVKTCRFLFKILLPT
jgi:hypothetical protein